MSVHFHIFPLSGLIWKLVSLPKWKSYWLLVFAMIGLSHRRQTWRIFVCKSWHSWVDRISEGGGWKKWSSIVVWTLHSKVGKNEFRGQESTGACNSIGGFLQYPLQSVWLFNSHWVRLRRAGLLNNALENSWEDNWSAQVFCMRLHLHQVTLNWNFTLKPCSTHFIILLW